MDMVRHGFGSPTAWPTELRLADSRPGGIVHSKKQVVDVLKRGNTFGELAIIFLIPRRHVIHLGYRH